MRVDSYPITNIHHLHLTITDIGIYWGGGNTHTHPHSHTLTAWWSSAHLTDGVLQQACVLPGLGLPGSSVVVLFPAGSCLQEPFASPVGWPPSLVCAEVRLICTVTAGIWDSMACHAETITVHMIEPLLVSPWKEILRTAPRATDIKKCSNTDSV